MEDQKDEKQEKGDEGEREKNETGREEKVKEDREEEEQVLVSSYLLPQGIIMGNLRKYKELVTEHPK